MKIAMIVVRTLMGLLLLFASVSYFLNLTPPPTNMPLAAVTYNEGLAIVKLMTLVKAVELLCGLMFLIGRYVTLAVVLIFPIVINIVLFHGVVMPSGLGPGLFLLFGEFFLAYYYRKNYAPLFAAK